MVNEMTQFNEDDTPLMDIMNESDMANEFQEFDSHAKKAKSTNNVMRQIEIMRENKLLKSCIDDIYDY